MQCTLLHLQKASLKWLSFVSFHSVITHKVPAVMEHHVVVPSALAPFLHSLDVLVETFSLLYTYIAKVFWESV